MLIDYLQRKSDGQLYLEDQCLETIASNYKTPFYLVSAASLRQTCRWLKQITDVYCPNSLVSYAYNANSLPEICTLIGNEGIGAEVSSFVELRLALDIGINPQKIFFNGPFKSEDSLLLALESGIGYINADSFNELERINRIAMRRGKIAHIGLRIGPTITNELHGRPSRFGVDCKNGYAKRCLQEAKNLESIKICGVHFHLGTQIGLAKYFTKAISEAVELVSNCHKESLMEAIYIDIGGGFGVIPSTHRPEVEKYMHSQIQSNLIESVNKYAAEAAATLNPSPRIIIEPGRFIVARSTILLTHVVGTLTHKKILGNVLDAGQNIVSSNLTLNIFHDVLKAKHAQNCEINLTNLYGCMCYESDAIAMGLPLPSLSEGDLLVVLDCGAYDMQLVTSFIVPRPAVILISDEEVRCIRSESY